jgi:nucleotide-binding universal stress UspA family protein
MASKVLTSAHTSLMLVPSEEGRAASLDVPYRSILTPVDLTEHSKRSARVAAELARAEGAELLLVTVAATPEVLGIDASGERTSLARRLAESNREAARRELEALRSSLGGNLNARTLVIHARDVVMALEDLADSTDASLLVLGARGRTENLEHAQGAVVSRLLEHVRRPILVFRDSPEPSAGSGASKGEDPEH